MNRSRIAESLADYLNDALAVLPEPADFERAAEQILALYVQSISRYTESLNQGIGATFNLYFGDLSGQPYYAVALYSDLVPPPEPGMALDVRVLKSFISQNWQLLLDPRNNIGLWYDDEDNLLYLDISAMIPDKQEAVRLGILYNEKEGFDLENGEPFTIGGTGTPAQNLPVPQERLPVLVRE